MSTSLQELLYQSVTLKFDQIVNSDHISAEMSADIDTLWKFSRLIEPAGKPVSMTSKMLEELIQGTCGEYSLYTTTLQEQISSAREILKEVGEQKNLSMTELASFEDRIEEWAREGLVKAMEAGIPDHVAADVEDSVWDRIEEVVREAVTSEMASRAAPGR